MAQGTCSYVTTSIAERPSSAALYSCPSDPRGRERRRDPYPSCPLFTNEQQEDARASECGRQHRDHQHACNHSHPPQSSGVLAAQGQDDRPEREMGARSPRERDTGVSRTLRYVLARWVTTKAWSAQR